MEMEFGDGGETGRHPWMIHHGMGERKARPGTRTIALSVSLINRFNGVRPFSLLASWLFFPFSLFIFRLFQLTRYFSPSLSQL